VLYRFNWNVDLGDCATLESTVNSVLTQNNRLDDFASAYDDNNKYRYANSSFHRLMRKLVSEFTGDEQDWQKKLVWSNLFKIAPKNGGNPSLLMIRDEIPLYIELLKNEIRINKPDLVIFATNLNFFDPYKKNKKYASFRELVKEEDVKSESLKYICLAGTFIENPDVKIIVSTRPEYRPVDIIVKQIREVYDTLK